MEIKPQQIKRLRGLAHVLKPVVIVGQHGLTDAVMNEIEIALDHHELIKVKLRAGRDTRAAYIESILAHTSATVVLSVGQVLALYRANPNKPRIDLSAKARD